MGFIVVMRNTRTFSTLYISVNCLYNDLQEDLGTKDIDAYLTESKVRT